MKKYGWVSILAALVLALGSVGIAYAEIIPPQAPGQQIGYPAVVLCEKLTLREAPATSSKAVKSLKFGTTMIIVGADQPNGAKRENGFIYCTLGEAEDSLSGWVNEDYIAINPYWLVTERQTAVYAWNSTSAPKIALLGKGTRLPILKDEGSWYIVSLRGAVGWVRK